MAFGWNNSKAIVVLAIPMILAALLGWQAQAPNIVPDVSMFDDLENPGVELLQTQASKKVEVTSNEAALKEENTALKALLQEIVGKDKEATEPIYGVHSGVYCSDNWGVEYGAHTKQELWSCKTSCDQSPSCQAISFSAPEGNKCVLCATAVVTSHKNWVTYTKMGYDVSPVVNMGYEWDPKNGIDRHPRSMQKCVLECAKRCQAVAGCAHFTYFRDHGCHLTNDQAKLVSKSGPVNSVAGSPSLNANVEWSNFGRKPYSLGSAEKLLAQCRETPDWSTGDCECL